MKVFADLMVLVFVVSSVLSVGLNLSMSQIVPPLRRARLVALSLVANYFVVPAALLVGGQNFDDPHVAIMVIVVALLSLI